MKKLFWFRRDFRLTDNPALAAAAKEGEVIPVFIWSPEEEGSWQPGLRSRIWLRHALDALECPVVLRKGSPLNVLKELAQKTKADALFFNRCYEPELIKRDLKIIEALDLKVKTFNASLLVEPWEVQTKQGNPFQVFTPFWKAAAKCAPFTPGNRAKLNVPSKLPPSEKLDLPDESLNWEIGEKAAQKKLSRFRGSGSSYLSPHLHFGEIGPRQVWAKMQHYPEFVRQLFWREFAYHLLYHFPHAPDRPLQEKFARFPWVQDAKALKAWKEGKTGYPIVDASMRQLKQEGWMPNRMRMIAASFLTKDLLIPWQKGAKWFWEQLVDADLANNTLGWQWTAGCGADAAPYFRIFNPVAQSKKFDPEGDYIRRYVPELAQVPGRWIHAPWEAPEISANYPKPIIDHKLARERALNAFEKVKL